MRPPKPDFKKPESSGEQWYDITDDWTLIEASFAAQYGIRLRCEPDMTWGEFSSLLCGLGPKTPLGQIVSIRSENDQKMLKNFNASQWKIRNDWRTRNFRRMDAAELEQQMSQLERQICAAFGK